MWVRPYVEVLLVVQGHRDTQADRSDIDEIGENLGAGVKLQHDGMVDIEAEKDSADWK